MDREKSGLYTAVKNGCRHVMVSYYHLTSKLSNSDIQLSRFRKLGVHVFLDSGAYSAWKNEVDIDIDKYIRFIKDNSIGKYVNLDVVGDPEKTYENQKYMERQGLQPIPVFHFGSDIKYLQQLVDEDYYCICLGGTVGKAKSERIKFFDECFNQFPDKYFHGLGMTDPQLMLRYPWFSVDSTTWLVGRRFCQLITMEGRVDLPKDMSVQERVALNVKFLRILEKEAYL
jgi:hypothetical protein